MIEAELPDGRILEFPDGTDPAVIQRKVKELLGVSPAEATSATPETGDINEETKALINERIAAETPGEGTLRERLGTTGLPRVPGPEVGTNRDLRTAREAAYDVLRKYGPRASDPALKGIESAGRAGRRGAYEGVTGLAGLPREWIESLKSGYGPIRLPAPVAAATPNPLPSSGELMGGVEKVTGDPAVRHEPQGAHERALRNLMMLYTASLGGAPGATLAAGTGGAATGEAARAFLGPQYDPLARTIGNIIGSLGYAPSYGKTGARRMLREATRDITPRQWKRAAALEKTARREGIPLMGHEALAPDSSHPIAQVGGYTRASIHGAPVSARLARRPAQTASALAKRFRKASPKEPSEPQMIARQAAETARSRIDRATGARTRATAKFFKRAGQQNIGEDDARNIVKAIDERMANLSPKSPAHKELADIKGLLLNEDGTVNTKIAPLHSHVKYLRDTRFKANPANPDAISKEQASQIKPILEMLKESFGRASKDFRRGTIKYKELSEKLVKPLLEGPVAKMEKAGGKEIQTVGSIGDETISKAVRAMASTKEIGPAGINKLAYNMNKQNRAAFPRLARYYLESTFNDAAARIQGAPVNPLGHVNWLKIVYGGKDTQANTMAVLRGVAKAHGENPSEYVRGWRNLFKVLDATGRTPGIGSPTVTRQQIDTAARRTFMGEARDLFVKLKFDLAPWRTRELAKILTAKDSVAKIRELAYMSPRSKKAQALVVSLLAPVLSEPAEE